ncbi:ATP-binding protein [uncultured Paracoccus sp.]|uniref:sensor histidine kinase n=1 Tax=uncultured Paracoccus sp. TaxID=189685 RepID=UPI0026064FC1|nr:ATP-binding protein [uncultured Paracoccus sp.]
MRLMPRLFPRLGVWQRLMLLIGGTLALMWLGLALTSVTFARFQTQFSGLAASQVPRIALTGELAGHSAQLAGLTTRIIGGEGESAAQLAELSEVAARLTAALADPGLRLPPDSQMPGRVAALQRDLAALPPLYGRRQDLAAANARDIDALRWLNVDIQDEVDPLLDDYDFNIRARMLELEDEDDSILRSALVDQVERDRRLRDQVFQVGTEAGTAVTLLLQIAVSSDAAQIDQLAGLAWDMMARLGETVGALPERTEFLTLRQSYDRLRGLADPGEGLVQRRRAAVALQAQTYGTIQSAQDGVALLQDTLAGLAAEEKSQVLATIAKTAERARGTMAGLVALTLALGLIGLAIVSGVMRSRIVAPLRALMGRMLDISESAGTEVPATAATDEISRIRAAVDEFGRAITARDQAIGKLKDTQADLVQAGKMAALGNLSAGISHELNQPLAALRYRTMLLERAGASGDAAEARRQLDRIAGLTDRMEAIISHLRRFARRADNARAPLRLGEPIEGALSLLQGRIEDSGATVTVSPAAEAARVMGDPILIEQVVINLVGNALDAIAETEGAGRIALDVTEADGFVDLTVRDNGVGLGDLSPEEAVNPFVTSKEAGRGMGLGLSISYNIAKDMGGDLWLQPAPDRGVVARLRLPAVKPDDS